jgi:hypothetical protein
VRACSSVWFLEQRGSEQGKKTTLRVLSRAETEHAVKPRQVHSFFCRFRRKARLGLLVIGKAQLPQHRKNRRRTDAGLIIAALSHSHTHTLHPPPTSPVPALLSESSSSSPDEPIHRSSFALRPAIWVLGGLSAPLDARNLGPQAYRQGAFTSSPRHTHAFTLSPTNVGTPTCPAFWLRLSRLSLSTLFPEIKHRFPFG